MSLTIVMGILGRPLFTLRSLWYLNSINLPWRIIVADGGNYPTVDRLLQEQSSFPNLNLTHYKRKDVDLRAYYQKCLNALRMVETPYVLMHDNDDFFTVGALGKLASFLDSHPDYSGVGGAVSSFFVQREIGSRLPFVQGKVNRWAVMYDPKFLQHPTAAERIERHFQRYSPTYYCLHRTSALTAAYEFIVESGIRDLPLHEIFLSLHTLLSGKITTDCSTIGYHRQANTSEADATVRPWPHRYLQEAWQADFHSAAEKFSVALHRLDPTISERQAGDLLKSSIGRYLSSVSDGTVYHGSTRGPVSDMLSELQTYGASEEDCRRVAADLEPIVNCLEGDECRRFMTTQAPDLVLQWKMQHAPYAIWASWKATRFFKGRR